MDIHLPSTSLAQNKTLVQHICHAIHITSELHVHTHAQDFGFPNDVLDVSIYLNCFVLRMADGGLVVSVPFI